MNAARCRSGSDINYDFASALQAGADICRLYLRTRGGLHD